MYDRLITFVSLQQKMPSLLRFLRQRNLHGRSLVMVCLLFLAGCSQAVDSAQIIDQAHFVHADDPQAFTTSRPVTLHDSWREDGRHQDGLVGWYRFSLGAAQDQQMAVLFVKFTQNIEVYFNGHYVGTSDPTDEHPVNWNRPFQFQLPAEFWREQDNYLDVRLKTDPNWGLMAPLVVGSTADVARLYEWQYFFQITANQIAFALTLVLAAIALVYYLADKRSLYAWYALGAGCWAIYGANSFLQVFPLSYAYWSVLLHFSADLFSICYVFYVHRYLSLRRVWVER